jgi:hypothetical protein
MSKIKNPLQFSHYFGINKTKVESLGALDPTLNVDAKLFIDPLLFGASRHSEMQAAVLTYKTFFTETIKLLEVSKKEGDIAWRTAYRKLLFREIKGTCLGYGAASIGGRAFGPKLTKKITNTAKEIIDLGVRDPDLFIALPLLEENVGPDLISDMTTNIIFPDLISFNERVLAALKVPTERFTVRGIAVNLPRNPTEASPTPVILVPLDVLRDLPVANDWEEVCHAAAENSVLRDKVNKLIGEIWKAKTRKDKGSIRDRALASREAFSALLEAIHDTEPNSYDFKSDPEGIFVWRRIHETISTEYPLKIDAPGLLTLDSAYSVVRRIIDQFQHLIENRGLSRELWHEGKRRNEKSIQRIFFAVADSYCKANNLDISPEVDTGTGQIDFKFSAGYENRVVVEIKLSDNSKLVPGYVKQLEVYKKAEKTTKGIYVVVDVGKLGKKDKDLLDLKNEQTKKKRPASEIFFIDGSIKPSASRL